MKEEETKMKLEKLDFSVAILAGLACLALLVNISVWAIFIGWAWYFALGANTSVFKQSIPPMILGYVVAAIAIVIYTASGYNLVALIVAVIITVFIVMLSLKTSVFACSLASFNAYSCLFAGYYAGNFPQAADRGSYDIKNVFIAVAWIMMANVIGLMLGWISVTLGSLGNKEQKS